MKATALWMIAPGKVALRHEHLPEPHAGEVLVKAIASGISRGTERLVLQGRVPVSEHQRMRAPFQQGDFGFPLKYGYASAGMVEAGTPDLIGRAVFCLHPHQDRYVAPADAIVPLPDGLPPSRAILAANMETALNVVWDSGAQAGDRIAIVGGGVVGGLVAFLFARLPGAEVTLIDIDPARGLVAEIAGCAFALPDIAPKDCDVVVHASASAAGLATALACAGDEAIVVEASWHGAEPVPLPLGGEFHSRRLTLRSSQVGAISPAKTPRWTHRRRLGKALHLLAEPRLDAFISGETAFADIAGRYVDILADPATLMHRIVY